MAMIFMSGLVGVEKRLCLCGAKVLADARVLLHCGVAVKRGERTAKPAVDGQAEAALALHEQRRG
jgi:hypothetical protein